MGKAAAATSEPVVALTADLTHPGAAETVVREAFDALGGPRGVAITTALGRPGQPKVLGDVIAFLLPERASYLTGATVNVDGGIDF